MSGVTDRLLKLSQAAGQALIVVSALVGLIIFWGVCLVWKKISDTAWGIYMTVKLISAIGVGDDGDEEGEKVRCKFCGKPIHIKNLASIGKGGISCGNLPCIIELADELTKEKSDGEEKSGIETKGN